MDTNRYIELRQAIDCGQLQCLQQCCQAGQLGVVFAALNGLTANDLPLLTKMLCGCAIQQIDPNAPPNPTGNECFDAVVGWAKSNQTTINVIQNILSVASGTGFPIVDQMVTILDIVFEQIEDASRADAGDPTVVGRVLRNACTWIETLEAFRKRAISELPDPLRGLSDALSSLVLGTAGFVTCCGTAPIPPLPGGGGGGGGLPPAPPAPPPLPPAPPTPTLPPVTGSAPPTTSTPPTTTAGCVPNAAVREQRIRR